jgi:alpha-tubulin suppressor-like RCC1 family protein
MADRSWRRTRRLPAWLRGPVALVAVLTLLPAVPAGAVEIPWPDALDPDAVRAATVGATSVAAGGAHSCVVTSLGGIYCWGENSSGQLGDDNAPADSGTAVPAGGNGDLNGVAVQVAAGEAHTCALDYDGSVFCWGDNSAGQLGIGGGPDQPVPTQVPKLAGRVVVEISAGAEHSCAIDEQGRAWCWGDNSAGQLGNPEALAGSDEPVPVSTTTGMAGPVVDIDAGAYTTCAATTEGAAFCWGADGTGQLGDGPAPGDQDEPVEVAATGPLGGGAKVRLIAVGGRHTCSVDDQGAGACWGEDALGAGAVGPQPEPVAVDTGGVLDGVRLDVLSAGGAHTCAVDTGGAAYCWGSDTYGQLGDGGASADRDVPVVVARGARVAADLRDIDTGGRHTCALGDDGVVYCWGSDSSGQLGNGAAGAGGVPVQVVGVPRPPEAVQRLRVTAVDAGLRARWQEPDDLGSGQFVLYLAITAGFESGCTVPALHTTTCILPGLTNGTSYEVAVLALTTDGATLSEFLPGTPRAARAPGTGGSAPVLPITGPGLPLQLGAAGILLSMGAALLVLVRRRTRPEV